MEIKNLPVSCMSELFDYISNEYFFWEEKCNDNESDNKISLNKKPKRLWYRGHKSRDYLLIPSLYRKIGDLSNNTVNSRLLKSKENLLLEEFSTRNYFRFQYKLPENELLWMSIMQHYGVSTRLLDWSENIMPALFFALEEYFKNRDFNSIDVPCIWVMNPKMLNNAFSHFSSDWKTIARIRNNDIPSLITKNLYSELEHANFPLAVKSPINSERIEKQSGVFCILRSEEHTSELSHSQQSRMPSSA